jgi:hypothetical protein
LSSLDHYRAGPGLKGVTVFIDLSKPDPGECCDLSTNDLHSAIQAEPPKAVSASGNFVDLTWRQYLP